MFYDSFARLVPGQTETHLDGYVAKPLSKSFYRIEDLDKMRKEAAMDGYTFKARFRGPRGIVYGINRNGKEYFRKESLRQSVCLKEEAKFFTIYDIVGA